MHTLSLNFHTGLGTKRVLKTELGTQKKLPTEMTLRIHGYAKEAAKLFLFAVVLSRIRFVKFCQTGVFVVRIPGYTQENDHFLSVYSIRLFHSTNSPSTWNSYLLVCFLTPVRKFLLFVNAFLSVVDNLLFLPPFCLSCSRRSF